MDYALQVIPDIHEVMPLDLIMAMDSAHLYFGDNPPVITTPFYIDSLYLTAFIHNTDYNPNSPYFKESASYENRFSYAFFGQHRGVAEKYSYVRDYRYEPYLGTYFHEYANVNNDIFIMGEAPYFTAYFNQVVKREVGNESMIPYITDYEIEMNESIILSGKVTPQGIEQFRMGMRVEGYSYTSPQQGISGLPEIHDMFIYDARNILPYDTAYYNMHLEQ